MSEVGKVTVSSLVHSSKTCLPMWVRPAGKVTAVSEMHKEKAESPRWVRREGTCSGALYREGGAWNAPRFHRECILLLAARAGHAHSRCAHAVGQAGYQLPSRGREARRAAILLPLAAVLAPQVPRSAPQRPTK